MAIKQQLLILAITYCYCRSSTGQNLDITIAFHPEDVETNEHTNVKFICTLQGELTDLSLMTLNWLKDGEIFTLGYNNHQRLTEGNLILDISDVSIVDAGEYQCIVTHKNKVIAMSRPGTLTVHAIPDKKYPRCLISKSVYADGEEILISCVTETKGNFNMKWLDVPDATIITLTEEKGYTTLSARFHATKEQHTNDYKCLMKLEREQVPRFCSTQPVNITNKLPVYIIASKLTDNSINLACKTNGHFENVSYTWMFQNCSDNSTNNFRIKDGLLIVNNLITNTSGCQITCTASKNNASGNYTYMLSHIQYNLQQQHYDINTIINQEKLSTTKLIVIVLTSVGCCVTVTVLAYLLYKNRHKYSGTLPGLTPKKVEANSAKRKDHIGEFSGEDV